MGNVSIVEGVPLRGSFEGFFVVKDTILERFDLLSEALVLEGGIGLVVGDGGEESIRNCVKESSIDFRVCLESGLCGS